MTDPSLAFLTRNMAELPVALYAPDATHDFGEGRYCIAESELSMVVSATSWLRTRTTLGKKSSIAVYAGRGLGEIVVFLQVICQRSWRRATKGCYAFAIERPRKRASNKSEGRHGGWISQCP